jgi:two-component system sensor histidine kinase ChvG
MEDVNLTSMIDTLVDIYRSTGRQGKVHISWEKPDKPIMVKGLEGRLGQVVRNILDNALSFSPDGSKIAITLNKKNRHVILTIDDEGPGIPTQNVEDIFKRFYSERPAGEVFGTHSGLGLSISRQIIEAHGGTIRPQNRVENDKIVGARFEITLPVL